MFGLLCSLYGELLRRFRSWANELRELKAPVYKSENLEKAADITIKINESRAKLRTLETYIASQVSYLLAAIVAIVAPVLSVSKKFYKRYVFYCLLAIMALASIVFLYQIWLAGRRYIRKLCKIDGLKLERNGMLIKTEALTNSNALIFMIMCCFGFLMMLAAVALSLLVHLCIEHTGVRGSSASDSHS